MDDDPRTKHPGHDPSIPPPKTVMGVRIPSAPSIKDSIPPSIRRHGRKATRWGLSSAAVVTLGLGVWQGLPSVLAAMRSEPKPAIVQPACATQEAVDQAHVRITELENKVDYDFQLLCKLNGGNPGYGAVCDGGFFQQNRTPPPLFRTDHRRE